MPATVYKGFTIIPRSFQVRGTALWTQDLLIGRHGRFRAFSGPATYETHAGAEAGCTDFACHIIDGEVKGIDVGRLR